MVKNGLLIIAFIASTVLVAEKVVVFDAYAAIMQTQLAKDKYAELSARPYFKDLAERAEKKRDEMNEKVDEYNNKVTNYTDQDYTELSKQVSTLREELKSLGRKIKEAQQMTERQIVGQIQPQLSKVLADYMKKHNIEVILRKENVYVSLPSNDITNAVAKELDKLSRN